MTIQSLPSNSGIDYSSIRAGAGGAGAGAYLSHSEYHSSSIASVGQEILKSSNKVKKRQISPVLEQSAPLCPQGVKFIKEQEETASKLVQALNKDNQKEISELITSLYNTLPQGSDVYTMQFYGQLWADILTDLLSLYSPKKHPKLNVVIALITANMDAATILKVQAKHFLSCDPSGWMMRLAFNRSAQRYNLDIAAFFIQSFPDQFPLKEVLNTIEERFNTDDISSNQCYILCASLLKGSSSLSEALFSEIKTKISEFTRDEIRQIIAYAYLTENEEQASALTHLSGEEISFIPGDPESNCPLMRRDIPLNVGGISLPFDMIKDFREVFHVQGISNMNASCYYQHDASDPRSKRFSVYQLPSQPYTGNDVNKSYLSYDLSNRHRIAQLEILRRISSVYLVRCDSFSKSKAIQASFPEGSICNLFISGHGTATSLDGFGSDGPLTPTTPIEKWAVPKALSSKGAVIASSCSNAQEIPEGINMLKYLSSTFPGHIAYAASKDLRTMSISNYHEDGSVEVTTNVGIKKLISKRCKPMDK